MAVSLCACVCACVSILLHRIFLVCPMGKDSIKVMLLCVGVCMSNHDRMLLFVCVSVLCLYLVLFVHKDHMTWDSTDSKCLCVFVLVRTLAASGATADNFKFSYEGGGHCL